MKEYLGEMAWYLDAFFDRREGGIEVFGAMHKWVVPCNWKFAAENFGGDAYHISWNHLSALRTGTTSNSRDKEQRGNALYGTIIAPGNGHSVISRGSGDYSDSSVQEIFDYDMSVQAEVARAFGAPPPHLQSHSRHGLPQLLHAAEYLLCDARVAPARPR